MGNISNDSRRLSVSNIVGSTAIRESSPSVTRLAFAGKAVVIVYVAAFFILAIARLIHPWLFALIPAIAVIVATVRVDDSRLMWWRWEKPDQVSYHLLVDPDNEQTSIAKFIQIGDLIKAPIEDAGGGSPGGEDSEQDNPRLEEFFKVIAKRIWPDRGRISLCAWGIDLGSPYEAISPDSTFYCHKDDKANNRQSGLKSDPTLTRETASALADLLDLLPEDNASLQETKIVRDLQNRGHDAEAVRRAIRIALSGCMISRSSGRSDFSEFFRLFTSNPIAGGHDSCYLRLNKSGDIWKEIGSSREGV